MRVSSNSFYELGILSMQRQQSELLKSQQQVATGKKILTPADDPVAAVRALELTESLSLNEQYKANSINATNSLKQEDTVLSSIEKLIVDVRTVALAAGSNPSTTDKASYAAELRLKYQELLSLSNQQDGNGQYLFSGFKGSVEPFSQVWSTGVYAGDQGQRKVQISPSREIDTNDAGADLFKPGVAGQDLFKTISDFVTALEGTFTTASVTTVLAETATEQLNVQVIHGAVGVRLKEIESVKAASTALTLNYQQTLSSLQDIDYATAIAELNQRQFNLEAAQQAFAKASGMSLFNYL